MKFILWKRWQMSWKNTLRYRTNLLLENEYFSITRIEKKIMELNKKMSVPNHFTKTKVYMLLHLVCIKRGFLIWNLKHWRLEEDMKASASNKTVRKLWPYRDWDWNGVNYFFLFPCFLFVAEELRVLDNRNKFCWT